MELLLAGHGWPHAAGRTAPAAPAGKMSSRSGLRQSIAAEAALLCQLDPAAADFASLRVVRRGAYASQVEQLVRSRTFARIATRVVGDATGAVCSIHSLGADTHGGGRETLAVTFASGARAALRPSPMWAVPILRAASELAAAQGVALPRLPAVAAIDDGFELVEWVEHRPGPLAGSDRAEFARRAGALAAIAWVTGVGDLHAENVVADGLDLVVVDGEVAGRPFPADSDSTLTGLLPRPGARRGNAPLGGPAPSDWGIGLQPGQPGQPVQWGIPLVPTRHWIADEFGPAQPRVEDLAAGFAAAVTALSGTRQLRQLGGLADLLCGSRHVARPTFVYAALLCELALPDAASRPARVAACASRLAALPALPGPRPDFVGRELADLAAGDIPRFELDLRRARISHHSGWSAATPFDPIAAFHARVRRWPTLSWPEWTSRPPPSGWVDAVA